MASSALIGFTSRLPGLQSVYFRPNRTGKAPKVTLVFESVETAKQAQMGVRKQGGFAPLSIFRAGYHDHSRHDLLEIAYCPRSNYSNEEEDRTAEGQARVLTYKAKSAASGYSTIGAPIETTDELISKLYRAICTYCIEKGSLLEESKTRTIYPVAFQKA